MGFGFSRGSALAFRDAAVTFNGFPLSLGRLREAMSAFRPFHPHASSHPNDRFQPDAPEREALRKLLTHRLSTEHEILFETRADVANTVAALLREEQQQRYAPWAFSSDGETPLASLEERVVQTFPDELAPQVRHILTHNLTWDGQGHFFWTTDGIPLLKEPERYDITSFVDPDAALFRQAELPAAADPVPPLIGQGITVLSQGLELREQHPKYLHNHQQYRSQVEKAALKLKKPLEALDRLGIQVEYRVRQELDDFHNGSGAMGLDEAVITAPMPSDSRASLTLTRYLPVDAADKPRWLAAAKAGGNVLHGLERPNPDETDTQTYQRLMAEREALLPGHTANPRESIEAFWQRIIATANELYRSAHPANEGSPQG